MFVVAADDVDGGGSDYDQNAAGKDYAGEYDDDYPTGRNRSE